MLPFLGQSGIS